MAPSKPRRPSTYNNWMRSNGPAQIPRSTVHSWTRRTQDATRHRSASSVTDYPRTNVGWTVTTNQPRLPGAINPPNSNQCLADDRSPSMDNSPRRTSPQRNEDVYADDDEQNTAPDPDDELIGPSAVLSKGSVITLVFALFINHGLTKECLKDLLKLVNIIVPNSVPRSKYFFESLFYKDFNILTHFFCPTCETYLGLKTDSNTFHCSFCQHPVSLKTCLSKNSYFLSSPIKEQLKDYLETTNLWGMIQKTKEKCLRGFDNMKSEIYTGNLYQNTLFKKFVSVGANFSMALNTDGVKLFKSSKEEAWPIFCSINELDFNMKPKFLVLNSLFIGKKKPCIDTFFEAFIQETRDLFYNGFTWELNGIKYTSKVAFSICIADAVARCKLTNTEQFNGFFGCGWCKHRGETVPKNNGYVRVYPLQTPLPSSRTHSSTLSDAKKAVQRGFPVNGIKGPSMLSLIPGFNVISGMIPDFMHCGFLGVVSYFTCLWLGSSGEPYFIRDFTAIDNTLSNVKTPSEILRNFRPIAQFLSNWKASEFRVFFLYFSPVILYNRLPRKYYRHWLLFVHAMRLLLQKQIPDNDIKLARRMISKFLYLIPQLYGLCHVTYNAHILLHVVDTVEQWGAPWAYSAFIYEDAGGRLKRYLKGTHHLGEEIFQKFLASRKLREYAQKHIPNSPQCVKELYESIDAPLLSSVSNDFITETLIVKPAGSEKKIELSASNVVAIELRYRNLLKCWNAFSYSRIKIDGKTYSTERYSQPFKKDNSIVALHSRNSIVQIIDIIAIDPNCQCHNGAETCSLKTAAKDDLKYVFLCSPYTVSQFPSCVDRFCFNVNLTSFMKVVEPLPVGVRERQAIDFLDIKCKCLTVQNETNQKVCIECTIRIEKD